GNVILDMETLGSLTGIPLTDALAPLADAYELWLDEQEARLSDPAARLTGHEDPAAVALAQARAISARLRAGIGVLAAHPDAADAFRFANEAMWLQRVHTLAGNLRRDDETLELPDALALFTSPLHHSWRPFQLAFLLINLPSLADPKHEDRSA